MPIVKSLKWDEFGSRPHPGVYFGDPIIGTNTRPQTVTGTLEMALRLNCPQVPDVIYVNGVEFRKA